MNLRRITNFFGLVLVFVLSSYTTQAQSGPQLAGLNQDGLLQVGSNHPFVVGEYQIDITKLGLTSNAEATVLLRKYIDEGFTFEVDVPNGVVMFRPNLHELSQLTGNSLDVQRFNKKLQDVHRLRR